MIRFIIITLVAAISVLPGCGGGSGSGGVPGPRTTTVTQEQAIDFARTAVQERDAAIAKGATYEASPEGNGWMITVQSGKNVRLILLDAEGKVVSYVGE